MDRKIVTVKSYANIAIIKYWGKADAIKMIPATSSISLTLENMFTTTTVSFYHNRLVMMNFTSMVSCKMKRTRKNFCHYRPIPWWTFRICQS